jgi:hypothetical protein|nr:MAG TPA: Protein of unknown function (DUF669) [Caudoviricetes sp.]
MAKRKMKLDFTGVETFNMPAEGVHKVKIEKIEETVSQGGNDMFKVTFVVIAGASKGCKVIENYPLIDTALWKLKGLLEAIGMKADGRVQIDLDKMEGKTLELTVKYEEYEGKDRARVAETRKVGAAITGDEDDIDEDDDDEDDEDEDELEDEDDEDDDEEEEEEPPKKSKKSTKSKKSEPKSKKSTKSKKKAEPEPEDEDDDDDWDDWDEE